MSAVKRVLLTFLLSIALVISPFMIQGAFARSGSNEAPPEARVLKAHAQSLDSEELKELAQREAAAQGLNDFRGGEPVIIIGTSTLIIIALIVIIVILLT